MDLLSVVAVIPQDAAGGGFNINALVEYFNQGGDWMGPPLVCLILGSAIAIERIITLNLADVNTRKFILDVKGALDAEQSKSIRINSLPKKRNLSPFTPEQRRLTYSLAM